MTADRRLARRIVFVGVLVAQAWFVVRAYWAPHNELGFQMFPEASEWQAEIVRVTVDGRRVPIDDAWSARVAERGLGHPGHRQHANNGLASQIAFLEDAMAWVAANTPEDHATRYYEAIVTEWHNADPPVTHVLRSPERELP